MVPGTTGVILTSLMTNTNPKPILEIFSERIVQPENCSVHKIEIYHHEMIFFTIDKSGHQQRTVAESSLPHPEESLLLVLRNSGLRCVQYQKQMKR